MANPKKKPRKPRKPKEEQAQPHKLQGQLVLQKYNRKRQLVDQKAVPETLYKPNFSKAAEVWGERAKKEGGKGFVAAMFVGDLIGAKLNEHREVVDEGLMANVTLFQAEFPDVAHLIEQHVEEARAAADQG